jgi:hypothetical protein
MLRYILQRLQGVPAVFTFVNDAVEEDWPFIVRFVADLAAIAIVLFAATSLIFGYEAVRAFFSYYRYFL